MHILENTIFKIQNPKDFEYLALEIFKFQYQNNEIYQKYCDLLKINPSKVKSTANIPFLPIQFFKSHSVVCGDKNAAITFTSSGTTGNNTSKHLVKKLSVYEQSFQQSFASNYPNYKEAVIIGLLPSYLERKGSSLIYMVNQLIAQNQHPQSCTTLNLSPQQLQLLEDENVPVILIGVSFALIRLAEKKFNFKNTIVMETGGMKGMHKELIREELHAILKNAFKISRIHSEYGMTELLSQAYLKADGYFKCPPWMQFSIRNTNDPLSNHPVGKGVLNIIDLANLYSCSFIATDDLAAVKTPYEAKILGRMDHSDSRGCNLLLG